MRRGEARGEGVWERERLDKMEMRGEGIEEDTERRMSM